MENVALVTIKVPRYSTSSTRPSNSSSGDSSSSTTTTAKMLLLGEAHHWPSMPDMSNIDLKRCDSPPSAEGCSLGVKFLGAGMAACIADMATFPLDTAKVRLQIQGESVAAARLATTSVSGLATVQGAAVPSKGMLSTILTISRTEGVRALYSGLAPGLQRQMCFASVRIGLYDSVKATYSNLLGVDKEGKNIGLRILAGITTGGAAVLVAQPTDVVKVRMQAQGRRTGGAAPRYTSSMHAYRTIAVKEGARGLWKGTVPNVSRNAIVNCTELVSYDLIKESILSHKILNDGIPCHFLSAIGAGFFTTLFASPVDVLKTRFMNSQPGMYSGVVDCAKSMYREGGIKTFYKGCVPAFLRFGPWNVVMFISYEQLKKHLSAINQNTNNNTSTFRLPKIADVKSVSSRFI